MEAGPNRPSPLVPEAARSFHTYARLGWGVLPHFADEETEAQIRQHALRHRALDSVVQPVVPSLGPGRGLWNIPSVSFCSSL